jgi:hypothetical protein
VTTDGGEQRRDDPKPRCDDDSRARSPTCAASHRARVSRIKHVVKCARGARAAQVSAGAEWW